MEYTGVANPCGVLLIQNTAGGTPTEERTLGSHCGVRELGVGSGEKLLQQMYMSEAHAGAKYYILLPSGFIFRFSIFRRFLLTY